MLMKLRSARWSFVANEAWSGRGSLCLDGNDAEDYVVVDVVDVDVVDDDVVVVEP